MITSETIAVAALSIILGIASIATMSGLLDSMKQRPAMHGAAVALALLSAVSLVFYGVTLLTASNAAVAMMGYFFTVLFSSALVFATLLLFASGNMYMISTTRALFMTFFCVVVSGMGLVMYWEQGTVLGFITPLTFVLMGVIGVGVSSDAFKRNRGRRWSIAYAILLFLSALFLFLDFFFCLGNPMRRDWLWGFALVIHAINIGIYSKWYLGTSAYLSSSIKSNTIGMNNMSNNKEL